MKTRTLKKPRAARTQSVLAAKQERGFAAQGAEAKARVSARVAVSPRKPLASKKLIGKLVIFGVGLIGGSFALALRKAGAVGQVVGVGRTRANLLAARRLGIIDEIATDVAAAVRDADLVLLAVPLAQNAAVLAQIAPHLGATTIVTDAGSTKRDIIALARSHLGANFSRFVPAHPIAGTEKSGAQAAFGELFRDHELIITAQSETNPRAVAKVAAAWRLAGMTVNRMDAAAHDRMFALVSHLPHIVAYALVGQVAGYKDGRSLLGHTGGGFRDTSRIAGSSPEMWRDVCMSNRDALLQACDDYVAEFKELRDMLASKDAAGLEARFTAARDARARWLKRK
jgi:prephenate dehydrogenase